MPSAKAPAPSWWRPPSCTTSATCWRPTTRSHEYVALPFLRPLFGDAVLEPIRLHVDAKRYLCFAETGYWDSLSAASKHSLRGAGRARSMPGGRTNSCSAAFRATR